MKGRLVVPYSLVWAVLAGAAAVGASGCTSNESSVELDPEGPPAVKQVFVNGRNGNGLTFSDPRGQGNAPGIIDGGDLAYGIQLDVGQCTFDNQCPEADGFPAGYTCNTDLRLCLSGDGRQTGPGGASLLQDGIIFRNPAAAANGVPAIQIVFKELLDAATVEQFTCSCEKLVRVAPSGTVSLAAGNCGGGPRFTTDLDCGDCPDNPDTADSEAGTCFDINGDGVYDLPALLPGLVTVTCAGTGFTYTNGTASCATVSTAGAPAAVAAGLCDGFYDPSGNQVITIDNGYLGLGPRLYFYPGVNGPLPADSDCTLTVSDTIKDKDGLGMVAPSPAVTWHTEPVQRLGSDPEGATVGSGDDIPTASDVTAIAVTLNTLADPASIATDTITVTAVPEPQTAPPTASVVIPGTTAVDPDDATLLVWTPTVAPLPVGFKYTVTVAAGVEDTFGMATADSDAFEFITVEPEPE